jgi:hypothetical protein
MHMEWLARLLASGEYTPIGLADNAPGCPGNILSRVCDGQTMHAMSLRDACGTVQHVMREHTR